MGTEKTDPIAPEVEVQYLHFSRYFPHTPAALCIRECLRLATLDGYPCSGPVLDVGCGDGMFARQAFATDDVWGIDVDGNEGRRAQASRAYSQIIIGDITSAVLPKEFFRTAVANCSLEHIPNLDAALRIIFESLKPGSPIYAFVPTPEWAEDMRLARAARKLKMSWLSDAITSGLDGVFKHHHLCDGEEWVRRLEKAGFGEVRFTTIGTPAMTGAFEAFLLPSLIGMITRKLTGKWTLVPGLRKLSAFTVFAATKAVFRLAREEAPSAEYFIIGKRLEDADEGM